MGYWYSSGMEDIKSGMALDYRPPCACLIGVCVFLFAKLLVRKDGLLERRWTVSKGSGPWGLVAWAWRRLNGTNDMKIAKELPYAIELLSLCCMSGMNLFQSISTVGESGTGYVCKCFSAATRDFAAGLARADVLTRLRDRLRVPAAASLVSAIKQADMAGTPLAHVLAVHAEAARKEQYHRLLRSMELVPLKLAVSTALFLLPAVIIVAMVPHLLVFLQSGW